MAMDRYRFALRPRWVLSHLFVVVLVVVMVNLGFWQLRRLDERRDRNRVVETRTAEPVQPVEEVVAPDDPFAVGGEVAYRQVRAEGTYAANEEVLVRSRSLEGAPGSWVLTPLLLDDGSALVVNRGWVPNSGTLREVPASARAPSDPVSVTGLLRPTETRSGLGPTDPATGELSTLARVDLGRLADQVEPDLLPVWLQLTEQRPPPDRQAPRPLPPLSLDEGPHLGYAVQWFCFSAIAVVGYPLVLRRVARERTGRRDPDRADPDDHLEPDDPRLDSVGG
jgi:surfeit locus 1 family protein